MSDDVSSKRNDKMNQLAKYRPSTSSPNPDVLQCGQAAQPTVTYVPMNSEQSRNHDTSEDSHRWPQSVVIMDIISKLNVKNRKHGVKLFERLDGQTRRDNENDCDQGQDQCIPKEVYDEIMKRAKHLAKSNFDFEDCKNIIDQVLLNRNNIFIVDGENIDDLCKSGKLKPIIIKEPKCTECQAHPNSRELSPDEERSSKKKRSKSNLSRSRTPYTPDTQPTGTSFEKAATIAKPESLCKQHATKSCLKDSSHSRSRVRSRSTSCASSRGSRRSSRRRRDKRRSRSGGSYRSSRRSISISSDSSRSSSSSSVASYRSRRYRSRSRRRHSESRSRSSRRTRNRSRRSNKRHRDRDKDRRRDVAPSRTRSYQSTRESSSRHRSLKRSRSNSPETINANSTSVQMDPKENNNFFYSKHLESKSSGSGTKPTHLTTPFYHYPPERPYFYGPQHADPHMYPRYPYPNFIPHPHPHPHPAMPMPHPGPSHYYGAMNHPYAMNPYMPNLYKVYHKKNKSNFLSKSGNDTKDDKKKQV